VLCGGWCYCVGAWITRWDVERTACRGAACLLGDVAGACAIGVVGEDVRDQYMGISGRRYSG